MNIDRREANAGDIPTLRRLMQFYLYDIGSLDGWDIADDGTFGNADRIETFWTDPARRHYLVQVDSKPSGFVLTRKGTYFSGHDAEEISEFFILKMYRRLGVGRNVAHRIFGIRPGTWEVAVMKSNVPAQYFWRAAISGYTRGNFEEFTATHNTTDFVAFRLLGEQKLTVIFQ